VLVGRFAQQKQSDYLARSICGITVPQIEETRREAGFLNLPMTLN